MKGILKLCCPCCLRGEREEKREKVTYDVETTKQVDENTTLLQKDEQPQKPENGNVLKEEVKRSVEAISQPNNKNAEENKQTGEENQDKTMEYVDENGTNVRRVANKTITTTTTRTTSVGGSRITNDVLQATNGQGGGDGETEVVEYIDKNGRRVRRIVKKVVTTTTRKTPGDLEPRVASSDVLETSNYQVSGDGDNTEVVEYTDENGRRVRRVVKKVVTTTTRKTSGEGPRVETSNVLETSNYQVGGGDGEDTEVVEFTDHNGRRVRRVLKKTVTTTTSRTVSNGGPSGNVSIETREFSSETGGPGRAMANVAGIRRPKEEQEKHVSLQFENRSRPVHEKEVQLQFEKKPQNVREKQEVTMELRGQPFSVQLFQKSNQSTISTESFGSSGPGDSQSTIHPRSVVTKTIGGGEGANEVHRTVEISTVSSGHAGEGPITVVRKERSQVDIPEWLVEGRSAHEKSPSKHHSEVGIQLTYPSGYRANKVGMAHDKANEAWIQAHVAKRDKPEISILSLEEVAKEKEEKKSDQKVVPAPPAPAAKETEEEEEEESEEDSEYDEFEEEIVVMEVRRIPRFHKQLEIPKPQPAKVGVPVEDLLAVPQIAIQQESTPDEFHVEEKIEAVERPPVEYEMPELAGVLDKL